MAENALKAESGVGKAFYAKGDKDFSLKEIIQVLGQSIGKEAQYNSAFLEKVFAPTSDNLISEMLYSQCLQNCTRVMANTTETQPAGYADALELLGQDGQLESLQSFYGPHFAQTMKSAGPSQKGLVEKILY